MQYHLIGLAQQYARTAHEPIFAITKSGIKRPQIMHIQEVADLVWVSGGNDIEILAAWLHDSVEDTSITLVDIKEKFGKQVANIVHGLTDLDSYKSLPVMERKLMQANRVKNENSSVKRIKLADQISNVQFLSTDPINTMTFDECKSYIIGAKIIADECKGISPLLDDLFNNAYKLGIKKYKITYNHEKDFLQIAS